MSQTPFNPSPATRAQLLDAFSDPTLSLLDIARQHNTDLNTLTTFFSRPEIQDLLEQRADLASQRLRHIALNHLGSAIAAADTILAAFNAEESALPHDPATHAKRGDASLDYRARRAALYAAGLLLRFTRITHTPPAPRSHAEPGQTRAPSAAPRHRQTPPLIPAPHIPAGPAPTTREAPQRANSEGDKPAQTRSARPALPPSIAAAPRGAFLQTPTPTPNLAAAPTPFTPLDTSTPPPIFSGKPRRPTQLAALAGSASGP